MCGVRHSAEGSETPPSVVDCHGSIVRPDFTIDTLLLRLITESAVGTNLLRNNWSLHSYWDLSANVTRFRSAQRRPALLGGIQGKAVDAF